MYVRIGGVYGSVVGGIVALVIAGLVFWQVNKTTDAVNNTTRQALASAGISGDPSAASSGATVAAGDPSSLYRTANLRHALQTAQSTLGSGATIEMVKVEPGKVTTIGVKGGTATMAIVSADGKVTRIGTPAPGGPAIPLAQIDASAPAAMLAAVQRQGVTADQVGYLVVSAGLTGKGTSWDLFTTATPPAHYHANAHGKSVQAL